MRTIDVTVIGAGQAGLAMSHCLSRRRIDHVVVDRGQVGGRWVSQTWDSLSLLTPNWLNGLPGSPYTGDDPDGFMARDAFVTRLRRYAADFAAPVLEETEVFAVTPAQGGLSVATSGGVWRSRAVVVATGHCDLPLIPDAGTSGTAASIHSSQYRNPESLPDGGAIVVGASSSGVQIAEELSRAGRAVTLAVGRHTRLPRRWRGRDIFWWLDRAGVLGERTRDLRDPDAARRQPSLQLAGRRDDRNMDLATLQANGVRLAGRVSRIEGNIVSFADNLADSVAASRAKLDRLLARIDAFAGIDPAAPRPAMDEVDLSRAAPDRISLRGDRIGTIIWATGYRRAFPWLGLPALGEDGEITHRDGVTAVPGLYALGFRLLRKRDSSFIGGSGTDALALSQHISAFLGQADERAA